ncbi:DUF2064 domain-containing protein [Methylobacterium aquaticum]|nr:DUF2064 domain-containing protein [Methylobacterium aquaticum]
MRRGGDGEGLGSRTDQDPSGAAPHLRGGRRPQHGVSEGCGRQSRGRPRGGGAAGELHGLRPPGSESFFHHALPPGIGLIETWLPGFGACLFHAVTALFERGHEAACVLNADSPTLPTGLLVELADRLARPGDRAVLGPAEDGGYWVLGLKAPHRRLFEAIDWSTERVAAQTLARAAEIGLPVEILPTWYDVDDRASLRRLVAEVLQGYRPGPERPALHPAPATAAFLRDTFARTDLADRLDLARPREPEVA